MSEASELKYKPLSEDVSNYKVQMVLNGKQITMVPESLLYVEMDKAQRAEEILEMLAKGMNDIIMQRLPNIETWEQSIRDYWSGWRGEKELADHMIDYLVERYT